jgi:probable F420-dependent oxidoreductase
MRELVTAMRAIWSCWQDGTPLAFEGEFYTHTIMTPFFDPGPIASGPPKVFIAAVGEGMTAVAGEVADGMLVHGFTTEAYLREVTLPVIEKGLRERGKERSDFELVYPALVATGDTEEEMEVALRGTRKQIAFYGSTPAYKGALDLHGWGDLQPELNRLSKLGEWDEMGRLITDDVLHAFAIVGTPEEVPRLMHERFAGVVDRIRLYLPYESTTADVTPRVMAGFRDL